MRNYPAACGQLLLHFRGRINTPQPRFYPPLPKVLTVRRRPKPLAHKPIPRQSKLGVIRALNLCTVKAPNRNLIRLFYYTIYYTVFIILFSIILYYQNLNKPVSCWSDSLLPLQLQAAEIKEFADRRYGDSWHCFILNGSHGYYYSHKPEHSISFSFGGTYYFIFCTPLQ